MGVASVVLLSACQTSSRESLERTQVSLPPSFRNAPAAEIKEASKLALTAQQSNADSSPIPTNGQWWRVFGSAELNALVDQALANNRDLRIATIQLAQTKIRADQVGADSGPKLDAPLQMARQAAGRTGGASSFGPQTSYQLGLQTRWQPDVWGEQKGMAESAEFKIWRAAHARADIQSNLIAVLVSAYVNYLMANDAIVLAQNSEKTEQSIVKVLEERVALSDATADELEQKRATLAMLQLVMPSLILQREEARNNIALLVGSVPAELELTGLGLDTLSRTEIADQLPATLLFQRPDIRAVEARMHSANADIAVARARVFPAINLSGQMGYSGLNLSSLISPQTMFWNLISGLTASIFDGGRKEADKALAQSTYEEMVETYAKTILQAVREVEGALAGLRSAKSQLQLQQKVTGAGFNLYKLSDAGFGLGATDSASLFEAKKNYQRYLEEEQRRKGEYVKSQVALYQALGAGADITSEFETTHTAPKKSEGLLGLLPGARAGLADAELFSGERTALGAVGAWQVSLAGLYHQAVIPAVWRDLNTRFAAEMRGHGLWAHPTGYIEAEGNAPQSWHQLFITRFTERDAAERLCAALQTKQQQCAVEAAKSSEILAAVPWVASTADSAR